ncbi:hypothetical protein O3M35_012579 [Rhynocoris fuscipes]|uniref:Uncharacterized protein n=1 Tax=Rhynocoris fuscipes TaxID=488301 RepID=A0AAW1D074_9HEMI
MYRLANSNLFTIKKLAENAQVLKIFKSNFTSATISRLLNRFHASNRGNNKLLSIDNGGADKQIVRYKGDKIITKECNLGIAGSSCHIPEPEKPPCKHVNDIVRPKCKRVCLKCCKPVARVDECNRRIISLNKCKGIKYKYPSFTKTVSRVPLGFKWVADCCYWEECCRRVNIGRMKEGKPIKELQREVLGFKKRNESSLLKMKQRDKPGSRRFSTFTGFRQKTGDGCEPTGGLKCLKIDAEALKRVPKLKKYCLKICVPCCKQAREPPICTTPFKKPPCEKLRPPRPSFSECQDILTDPDKCECQAHPVICEWGKKKK